MRRQPCKVLIFSPNPVIFARIFLGTPPPFHLLIPCIASELIKHGLHFRTKVSIFHDSLLIIPITQMIFFINVA